MCDRTVQGRRGARGKAAMVGLVEYVLVREGESKIYLKSCPTRRMVRCCGGVFPKLFPKALPCANFKRVARSVHHQAQSPTIIAARTWPWAVHPETAVGHGRLVILLSHAKSGGITLPSAQHHISIKPRQSGEHHDGEAKNRPSCNASVVEFSPDSVIFIPVILVIRWNCPYDDPLWSLS